MHRRQYFKKHFDKASLAQGIDICRMCHDAIHKTYTEMELAKHFSSLDSLRDDERLQVQFVWISKQRINTS